MNNPKTNKYDFNVVATTQQAKSENYNFSNINTSTNKLDYISKDDLYDPNCLSIPKTKQFNPLQPFELFNPPIFLQGKLYL